MSGEHGGHDHTHTIEGLWKWILQDTAPKHIMHDVQDGIRRIWVRTILLEKCWVHVACSLNGGNNFILLLLRIPLVYYGAVHNVKSRRMMMCFDVPLISTDWEHRVTFSRTPKQRFA
jgi:hypothetical protein